MKDSTRFLCGVFISRLGDSFSFLAFTLILVAQEYSNSRLSLFLLARYLPGVLVGFWGRRLIDRMPKQQALTMAYLTSAVLTIAAAWYCDSPKALLAISLMLGITYAFYVPLQKSFIPYVFTIDRIKWGNTATQLADVLAKTIGFMLAGIVFKRAGPQISFVIDALSFVAIAISLSAFSTSPASPEFHDNHLESAGGLPVVAKLVAMIFALAWIGTGTLFTLEASYAKTYLDADETLIGLIFACATLGSLFTPLFLKNLRDHEGILALVVAVIIEALCVGCYACTSSIPFAIFFIASYGLFLTMRHILIAVWIHTHIPAINQGSAFAFQQGMANLAMLAGMGLSGPLSELIGVRPVITSAAALSIGTVLVVARRASRYALTD